MYLRAIINYIKTTPHVITVKPKQPLPLHQIPSTSWYLGTASPSFYNSREQHGQKVWRFLFLYLDFLIHGKFCIENGVHEGITQIIQGKKYQVLGNEVLLLWGLHLEGHSLSKESDILRRVKYKSFFEQKNLFPEAGHIYPNCLISMYVRRKHW